MRRVERIAGALPAPGGLMTAAIATYPAFRRDELADDDEDLLRVRAECGDGPRPEIAGWLADAGIGV